MTEKAARGRGHRPLPTGFGLAEWPTLAATSTPSTHQHPQHPPTSLFCPDAAKVHDAGSLRGGFFWFSFVQWLILGLEIKGVTPHLFPTGWAGTFGTPLLRGPGGNPAHSTNRGAVFSDPPPCKPPSVSQQCEEETRAPVMAREYRWPTPPAAAIALSARPSPPQRSF